MVGLARGVLTSAGATVAATLISTNPKPETTDGTPERHQNPGIQTSPAKVVQPLLRLRHPQFAGLMELSTASPGRPSPQGQQPAKLAADNVSGSGRRMSPSAKGSLPALPTRMLSSPHSLSL